MGVARALLATLESDDAVTILVGEFGWDAAFQALSLLRGPEAQAAFGQCWTHLLTGPITYDLRRQGGPLGSGG